MSKKGPFLGLIPSLKLEDIKGSLIPRVELIVDPTINNIKVLRCLAFDLVFRSYIYRLVGNVYTYHIEKKGNNICNYV